MTDLRGKYVIFTRGTENKKRDIEGLYVDWSFDFLRAALPKSFGLLRCDFVTLDE
jgi:hypothetical protein